MRVFTTLQPFLARIDQYRHMTGGQLIREASLHGFDGIDVSMRAANARPAPSIMEQLSPESVSFHSNFRDFNLASSNEKRRRSAVDELLRELALANAHQVQTLTFHPGKDDGGNRETALDLLWASLAEVSDGRDPGGCRLCVENMDGKPAKLCSLTSEIAATLDRFPSVLLTCDLAHLAMNGLDPIRFLEQFGPRIAHFHASGYIAGRKHQDVPFSLSSVELATAIATIVNEDAAIVIENRNWEVAEESLTAIRSLVRRH